jgi:hypothetical protein
MSATTRRAPGACALSCAASSATRTERGLAADDTRLQAAGDRRDAFQRAGGGGLGIAGARAFE